MDKLRISFIIPLLLGLLNAQSSVQGTVTDQNGNSLAGANVIISGTSVGAASDAEGLYLISIPTGTVEGQTVTLEASYIGYKSQNISVDAVSYTHLTLPTNREV